MRTAQNDEVHDCVSQFRGVYRLCEVEIEAGRDCASAGLLAGKPR